MVTNYNLTGLLPLDGTNNRNIQRGTLEVAREGADLRRAMKDEELLEQARRGENSARTELVMRHGRRLFGLAAALLGGGDADVNDVVQETFLAAFDGGLRAFRGGSSLSTWLSGVLINRVRKLRRY